MPRAPDAPGQPVEYFGHVHGEGGGTLTVDGVTYSLSHVGLELYHCESGEADWNLFAYSSSRHGVHDDSTGVALHGTVRLDAPPHAPADLVGLALEAMPGDEGWETDYVLADGRAADLCPAEGACIEIAACNGELLALRMRNVFEGYLEDGESCVAEVVLEVLASVVGVWRGRAWHSERLWPR